MCGIAGFYAFKDSHWKLNKKAIATLLEDIQARGTDATGYATIMEPGGDIFYGKSPVKVKAFVDAFLMRADVPVGYGVLLHTRSSTIGHASHNINNHPLIYGGVAAVHNGQVGQVDETYKHFEVEREALVDSAIIPLILSKLGVASGMKYMTEKIPGSGAIAAIAKGDGSLLLARDSKPLFVAYFPNKGLIWSSEIESLLQFTSDKALGLKFTNISQIENGKYMHIAPTGQLLGTGEFYMKAMSKVNAYDNSAWSGGTDYLPTTRKLETCSWDRCAKAALTAVTIETKLRWLCAKHMKKHNKGMVFPGGP